MLDVKKLLYKYKQFIEARRNAMISIQNLNERHRNSRSDENWFIRGGGTVSIPTEEELLFEEKTVERIGHLESVVRELTTLLDAIERGVNTLNKDQQELIRLRYFDDNTVPFVQMRLNLSEYKYHHLHRVALESMTLCLGALYVDDASIDRMIFAPLQVRYESTFNRREARNRAKEKPKKSQSFTAS